MPNCTAEGMAFGRLGRRLIEANFEGGALSSDGGLMLLRQVDRKIGLSKAVASALHDPRDPDLIVHDLRDLVAQRLYGLCCGYEDLNDHAALRQDPLMQTAVGTGDALASSPTLCRMEHRANRTDVVALNRVLVEQFIASHPVPPGELVLDVDASDIPLHGDQEQREFHAYYDHYCYLPLYVYCGKAMLACVLRRSRIDGARHAAAVIKLLVSRLRQAWPAVRIIVRGDSGFCRQRLIRWCERHGTGYVIGVARNARLHRIVEAWEQAMARQYAETGAKQRRIREFQYAAGSWDRERRIVTRLEFGGQGANPRFIVSNLDRPADELYDSLYCQRGEAENRIKETQLDLFGTRTSSRKFLTNWLRTLFSALAYTLMQRLRELALADTDLARASAATIRVKLLKIGAAVMRNTRRIRILFASHHPLRDLFLTAARALASP
ncbi:IS1380 family transposase [Parasulfuritortus cantonensis]|uniref:IS1380 family transposase n=1 Tax=Parasulfuritortus cantonensis TaxID=2528202 RepID=A0A4R1B8K6_9PROT|nr:IS1380 family transposase [Parasulfuritortus cantonensis]TCJ13418.1 IS1380 family transposase [Parasulfuritortus cantonensis]